MQKNTQRLLGRIFLGILLLCFGKVHAANPVPPEYIEVVIKTHVDSEEGKLYAFFPEGTGMGSSSAFKKDFLPDPASPDHKANRNYAQSVFVEVNVPGETIVPVDPFVVQTDNVLLANGTEFTENKDGDNIFLVSPLDGFLHFRVRQDFLATDPVFTATVIAPDNGATPFCISLDTCPSTTVPDAKTITRDATPFIFTDDIFPANTESIQLRPRVEADGKRIEIDFFFLRDPTVEFPYTNPTSASDQWTPDNFITFVQQFTIRAHHTLDWVLQIDGTGLEHSSVSKYYSRIVSVANGLLILVILGFALMWNFRALIPIYVFRRVMLLLFGVAVIMNLSGPLIKVIIQGADVLANAFMYTTDGVTGENRRIVANDFFYYGGLDYQDIHGKSIENSSPEIIEVGRTQKIASSTNPNSSFEAVDYIFQKEERRRLEDRIFNGILLLLTGVGYFLVAGVFLFRIVILWFLVILSPILFLLPILPITRPYFRYWTWVFTRWIFIGPILAICLGATVFIWKGIGVPITSMYSSDMTFPLSGNFRIASPGYTNYGLQYTKSIVEYIASLFMLWIPVLLSFWLTRKIPGNGGSQHETLHIPSRNKTAPVSKSAKGGGTEPDPSKGDKDLFPEISGMALPNIFPETKKPGFTPTPKTPELPKTEIYTQFPGSEKMEVPVPAENNANPPLQISEGEEKKESTILSHTDRFQETLKEKTTEKESSSALRSEQQLQSQQESTTTQDRASSSATQTSSAYLASLEKQESQQERNSMAELKSESSASSEKDISLGGLDSSSVLSSFSQIQKEKDSQQPSQIQSPLESFSPKKENLENETNKRDENMLESLINKNLNSENLISKETQEDESEFLEKNRQQKTPPMKIEGFMDFSAPKEESREKISSSHSQESSSEKSDLESLLERSSSDSSTAEMTTTERDKEGSVVNNNIVYQTNNTTEQKTIKENSNHMENFRREEKRDEPRRKLGNRGIDTPDGQYMGEEEEEMFEKNPLEDMTENDNDDDTPPSDPEMDKIFGDSRL